MPQFSSVREKPKPIECCETCKERGTVEVAPRVDFGADGLPCGPHYVPTDVSFRVTAASANALSFVGKVFGPREHIQLDGAGWLEGDTLRDVC